MPALYSKERKQAGERIKPYLYGGVGAGLLFTLLLAVVNSFAPSNIKLNIWVIGIYLIALGLVVGLLCASPYILEYIAFWRVDALRGTLDDPTRARIEKAFENVKEFIAKDHLYRSGWKKQIRLHQKLDGKSTNDLEEELQRAGVFNPHNVYYLRGKTLEEGLTLAVWQSRHDRDEAILRATEAAYTHSTAQAATAPDPQKRKELERQGEVIEQELKRLADERIIDPHTLSAFNGHCEVHFLDWEVEQLVLEVEAGDYSVRLEDVRNDIGETKAAIVQNDRDPVTVSGWVRSFTKNDTELIVKRRGSDAEERKYLW